MKCCICCCCCFVAVVVIVVVFVLVVVGILVIDPRNQPLNRVKNSGDNADVEFLVGVGVVTIMTERVTNNIVAIVNFLHGDQLLVPRFVQPCYKEATLSCISINILLLTPLIIFFQEPFL